MVVPSRLDAQLMKDNWSLVKAPIIIDQFANNEELLLGFRPKNIENDFIIGTLARLENEKGIDVVIKAVSEFKKRTPAVKLLIGGEGPEKERLMDMVRVLDLKEEVFFLGRLNQDQIAGFFGGINLFVISSLNESGPFAAIEAMAGSVPIVSTRVGAMTSRLDGYEEFLFECGGVSGLLQRMELIYGLCSTVTIGDYQIELRKRYLSNYSRSAIIKEYLSILV